MCALTFSFEPIRVQENITMTSWRVLFKDPTFHAEIHRMGNVSKQKTLCQNKVAAERIMRDYILRFDPFQNCN